MNDPEIELTVQIVNLIYRVRGFQAINELKTWLDEHATEISNQAPNYNEGIDYPTQATTCG